jgi:hypothetical protein
MYDFRSEITKNNEKRHFPPRSQSKLTCTLLMIAEIGNLEKTRPVPFYQESDESGKTMTRHALVFVLILLVPPAVCACECADKLSPEIEEFIFQTWKTATIEKLSDQERQERYDMLTKRLLSKAQEVNVPTERLEQLARMCIQFEETYRKTPAGWDLTDKVSSLLYTTEITRIILPIHLQMIGYCHRFCPGS